MPVRAPCSAATKPHQRGAAAAAILRRVGVAGHQRMAGQQGLDAGALHADAAAMDQPHLGEAPGVGGDQVLVDDGADVLGAEGVEIERVLDGDVDRLRRVRISSDT
jgi:hypothetical protein